LRIATIVGARPQFVKASVVSRALKNVPGTEEIIVHTGQHYDRRMSEVFFEDLDIPEPRYNLGVGSAPHGAQTGQMLEGIERVLLEHRPDWVLVYGDTNSTLAGALAAAKLRLPLAHIEAGLRSFNRSMPEEINRVLTDHASDLLFAPTKLAVSNLLREGIQADSIEQVGDVMYDAALFYGRRAETCSSALTQLGLRRSRYVLATIHRAENTDSSVRLAEIFSGIDAIAGEIPVVCPIHPRTRKMMDQHRIRNAARICFLDPVGYLDMLMLEKNSKLIITDSGGVQKEAFFFRIPCITMREETEWKELVELGWNRLVDANARALRCAVHEALDNVPTTTADPYGDGHASEQISQRLLARTKNTVASECREFAV
jgi:UDP-GlcNAc3NAcA epimerase